MKTSLKTAMLAPLALAALTLAGQASAQEQVVKIGHSGPLSGANAFAGKDNENGVRLALEELNAKKMVVGGKTLKFELVSEDDQCDAKSGVNVAQKLVDGGVKFVMGPYCSGVTIPASRIYDAGGALVSTVGTNPKVTQNGYKNLYRIIASDTQIGSNMAIYAANVMKVKNVAVIDDRTAFGQGVADEFTKEAKKQGLNVVGQEFTTDKATDFMAILTSIKNKKPDAIFYGGLDAQAGPMLRQMEQLGLGNVKYFGGDALCTEKLPELSGKTPALKNVTCATGGASVDKMQGGSDWKKRYDAKFPGQFQIYSPYAYDAAMVLADAMKRANSVDPKVFTPFLAKTEYKGVTANIAFTAKGELTTPAVTLYTFKDGSRVALN